MQACLMSSKSGFFAILGALLLALAIIIVFLLAGGATETQIRLKSCLEVTKAQLSRTQDDLAKAKSNASNTQKQLKEGRLRLHASTEEAKILRGRLERVQAAYKCKINELEKACADEQASHATLTSSLSSKLKVSKAVIASQDSKLATLKATTIAQAEELEVIKATLRSQATQLAANQHAIAAHVHERLGAKATMELQARNMSCLAKELQLQRGMGQVCKDIHAEGVKFLQQRMREGEEEREELKARIGELEEVIWVLGGRGVDKWNGGEDEGVWDEERGFVGKEREEGGFEANVLDSERELEGWDQCYDCDEESEGSSEWVSEDGEEQDEEGERSGDEDLVLV